MKRQMLKTAGTAVIAVMAATGVVWADQARPRNPGAASGGSSGGSSGSGGGNTGSTATPRQGGSSPWSGGEAVSRPSRPASGGSTPASVRTRGGGEGGRVGPTTSGAPGYSRPRDGALATGRVMPRTSMGALPPVVSAPVYWGANNNWLFYPWGFGGLGLGYMWDPLFWGGYGGYWGGNPAWGGLGMGGLGMGGMGMGGLGMGGMGWGGGDATSYAGGGGGYSSSGNVQGPAATGGLRLRVKPRQGEVIVNGYFAGMVDDFDGAFQKLKLPAGPHRIDIKADGYETLSFDVLVVEDEVTTYKGDMSRLQ